MRESKEHRDEMEQEANLFALALLMPSERFAVEWKKEPFDLGDPKDTRLRDIARLFSVSITMVVARAMMLDFSLFPKKPKRTYIKSKDR